MNCNRCGMPVSRDEYDKISHELPESVLDLGYCLSCSRRAATEIEPAAGSCEHCPAQGGGCIVCSNSVR